MRKFKWLLLTIMCVAFSALLYGCQNVRTITIDTRMIINQNFDGERVMTAKVDKNTLKVMFDGDVSKLQKMIEDYCPIEMSCRARAFEDGAVVEMSVPFASYNEYKAKILKILKDVDHVNPAVFYEYSNNLFKTGYTIEEKFCSADLFFWLTDALKTEFSSLKDEDLSGLYTNGKTELIFNSTVIETDSYISHSTMSSHGFKSMHAYMTINEDKTFSASVDLTISRENKDKIGNLDEIMKKTENSDISLMTKRTNTDVTYTYTFDAISMRSYISHMNTILHTDNTVFDVTAKQDDTQTLKAQQYIHQFLDASYFVDYSLSDESIIYSITLPGKLSFDSCVGTNGFITDADFTSDEHSTTAIVTMNPCDEVTVGLGTDISLENIEVYTKIHNDHKLERMLSFALSVEKDEIIGENFREKLDGNLNDSMSIERKEIEDTVIYKVFLKAESPEELSELTAHFLNGTSTTGDIIISGGINEKNELHKIRYAYDDKIEFSSFLGGSDAIDGIVYTFEYPKGYEAAFVDATSYESVTQSGNILSCKTYNKIVSIKTTAQKANVEGYIMQVLWYLSFVGILVSILFSLPNLIRCAKARQFSGDELELYTKKGYILVTVFSVSLVIFVLTSIRLIFRVY